jgi:hypothetical protein
MRFDGQVAFGPFRLDAANERLWDGSQVIALRPKPFAVLKYLIEHHGQLVTKHQLLDAVWPATFVGDAVLKDSIRQLREALDDDAASPRYIETAHRWRGSNGPDHGSSKPRPAWGSSCTDRVSARRRGEWSGAATTGLPKGRKPPI